MGEEQGFASRWGWKKVSLAEISGAESEKSVWAASIGMGGNLGPVGEFGAVSKQPAPLSWGALLLYFLLSLP